MGKYSACHSSVATGVWHKLRDKRLGRFNALRGLGGHEKARSSTNIFGRLRAVSWCRRFSVPEATIWDQVTRKEICGRQHNKQKLKDQETGHPKASVTPKRIGHRGSQDHFVRAAQGCDYASKIITVPRLLMQTGDYAQNPVVRVTGMFRQQNSQSEKRHQ